MPVLNVQMLRHPNGYTMWSTTPPGLPKPSTPLYFVNIVSRATLVFGPIFRPIPRVALIGPSRSNVSLRAVPNARDVGSAMVEFHEYCFMFCAVVYEPPKLMLGFQSYRKPNCPPSPQLVLRLPASGYHRSL